MTPGTPSAISSARIDARSGRSQTFAPTVVLIGCHTALPSADSSTLMALETNPAKHDTVPGCDRQAKIKDGQSFIFTISKHLSYGDVSVKDLNEFSDKRISQSRPRLRNPTTSAYVKSFSIANMSKKTFANKTIGWTMETIYRMNKLQTVTINETRERKAKNVHSAVDRNN